MAETTATATIIQAAEHLVIEEAKAIGTKLATTNSAEIKSIVNGVAKEAVAATDDEASTILQNIEDGVEAIRSEIVHGAVAVVEAVEKHPELLAEGALAIGIGIASIVQPELIVGSVAMIGKMAADAAKETVNEIVVESSTGVVKGVSKTIADETAELAAQDAAEKAKNAALEDAKKTSAGKDATVDVEASSSVTTEVVPTSDGSDETKVLTTVAGEATAIVREAVPDSKDGPVKGPIISEETVQTSATATSESKPDGKTVTSEGPAIMVTKNDLTGEAYTAVQKGSTTAVVDNFNDKDKPVSVATVDIQALAKEVAKEMSALEDKKTHGEGTTDEKTAAGPASDDSQILAKKSDDFEGEKAKTTPAPTKIVEKSEPQGKDPEEFVEETAAEKSDLTRADVKESDPEKENAVEDSGIEREENVPKVSHINEEATDAGEICLQDKGPTIEAAQSEEEVQPADETVTAHKADEMESSPPISHPSASIVETDVIANTPEATVQHIESTEEKTLETHDAKDTAVPTLWTKPVDATELTKAGEIIKKDQTPAGAAQDSPDSPIKQTLTESAMSTSQALTAILGNTISATKESTVKVVEEAKNLVPKDSASPATESDQQAVVESKPLSDASPMYHVTAEQHAATHAAVIEAHERIAVLNTSNELLHKKLDSMQLALDAISQTLADRTPAPAAVISSPEPEIEPEAEPVSNENNQLVLAPRPGPASTAVVNKRMSVFGSIGWLLGVGGGSSGPSKAKGKGHKRGKSVATSTPASVPGTSSV